MQARPCLHLDDLCSQRPPHGCSIHSDIVRVCHRAIDSLVDEIRLIRPVVFHSDIMDRVLPDVQPLRQKREERVCG